MLKDIRSISSHPSVTKSEEREERRRTLIWVLNSDWMFLRCNF